MRKLNMIGIIVSLILGFNLQASGYTTGLEPIHQEANQTVVSEVIKKDKKGLKKLWQWVRKKISKHLVNVFYTEKPEKGGKSLIGWWITIFSSGIASALFVVFYPSSLGPLIFLTALAYFIGILGLLGTMHDLSKKNVDKAWFDWSWGVQILTSVVFVLLAIFPGAVIWEVHLLLITTAIFAALFSLFSLKKVK